MSYLAQSLLATEPAFCHRCRAALVDQSMVFKDDGRADMAALAGDVLRSEGPETYTFYGALAASPGFAEAADNGDGTIDSAAVTDAQLLAAVQAEFPTVAALYYDPDGAPIPGV